MSRFYSRRDGSPKSGDQDVVHHTAVRSEPAASAVAAASGSRVYGQLHLICRVQEQEARRFAAAANIRQPQFSLPLLRAPPA